jgi:hypothetical protein
MVMLDSEFAKRPSCVKVSVIVAEGIAILLLVTSITRSTREGVNVSNVRERWAGAVKETYPCCHW